MANGASATSDVATYRVVRELGSRVQRTSAAIREPHELVVLQRFARTETLFRDAECLAKNWHPNIARVKHVDLEGEEVLLATDLVDGMTLADLLAASAQSGAAKLSPAVIVRILVDVLAGLNALHGLRDGTRALGAIHGALCPTNIVIGKDGVARLVSCVRARPVRIEATSEALAYAAPEALDDGGTRDVRSDVYAVGVVLWEALMGLRPYEANDPAQLLARQRAEEVMTPTLDAASPFAGLGVIAMRAIAFEPSLRYRTTAEMATALRKLAGTSIAPGTAVAAKVAEIAGDRIRARRAELDPAFPPRRNTPVAIAAVKPPPAAAVPVPAVPVPPPPAVVALATAPRPATPPKPAPASAPKLAPPPASAPKLAPPPASAPKLAPPPASAPKLAPPPTSAPSPAAPPPPPSAPVLVAPPVPAAIPVAAESEPAPHREPSPAPHDDEAMVVVTPPLRRRRAAAVLLLGAALLVLFVVGWRARRLEERPITVAVATPVGIEPSRVNVPRPETNAKNANENENANANAESASANANANANANENAENTSANAENTSANARPALDVGSPPPSAPPPPKAKTYDPLGI